MFVNGKTGSIVVLMTKRNVYQLRHGQAPRSHSAPLVACSDTNPTNIIITLNCAKPIFRLRIDESQRHCKHPRN